MVEIDDWVTSRVVGVPAVLMSPWCQGTTTMVGGSEGGRVWPPLTLCWVRLWGLHPKYLLYCYMLAGVRVCAKLSADTVPVVPTLSPLSVPHEPMCAFLRHVCVLSRGTLTGL